MIDRVCDICSEKLDWISSFYTQEFNLKRKGVCLQCNNKHCRLVREYLNLPAVIETSDTKEVSSFGKPLKKQDRSNDSYLKLLRARKSLGMKKGHSTYSQINWDTYFRVPCGEFDTLMLHVMNDIAREKDRNRQRLK